MPLDSITSELVLDLAQACEGLAQAALGVAQKALKARALTQDEFDQAFQDYGLSMQKARDMYYQASHTLAEQVAEGAELRALAGETNTLRGAVAGLQRTEHALSIAFGVVGVVSAIAAAVTSPGIDSAKAAASAAAALGKSIAG